MTIGKTTRADAVREACDALAKIDSVDRHARKGASGKAKTESRNKYPRKRTSPAANEGATLDPCDVCGNENPDGLDILKSTICRGCYMHMEEQNTALRTENDRLRDALLMYGAVARINADPTVAATAEPTLKYECIGFDRNRSDRK